MARTLLVAGASGVVGAAAVERFVGEGWNVVALSRRRPAVPANLRFTHLAVDLTDAQACIDAVRDLGPVSLLFCAVAEAPGLRDGWTDTEMIALNKRLFVNIADPLAKSGQLEWVALLQGTKAYGGHLHPIELPSREDEPRDQHANFYWEQEDHLRALAAAHGFGWTIFRPQVIFGGVPGAVMNPVAAIGAYAAICRELSLPFSYPANQGTHWELTDAMLLADALLWAATHAAARDQIFNLTNGDLFYLRDSWRRIGAAMGLAHGGDEERSLAAFMATDEANAAWRRMVERYGLQPLSLSDFLGQGANYVDLLLDPRIADNGGLPTVSGIKIRKAGFTGCCDSFDSLIFWLRRMAELKLLPGDLVTP